MSLLHLLYTLFRFHISHSIFFPLSAYLILSHIHTHTILLYTFPCFYQLHETILSRDISLYFFFFFSSLSSLSFSPNYPLEKLLPSSFDFGFLVPRLLYIPPLSIFCFFLIFHLYYNNFCFLFFLLLLFYFISSSIFFLFKFDRLLVFLYFFSLSLFLSSQSRSILSCE